MKWRFWPRQNPAPSDDCGAIEPLLSLYCDGMVSPSEARRVEGHLGACEDCRRSLIWMQATQRVIAERPAALPPPALRARIARAIAEAEPPVLARPVRRPLVLRAIFLAASAAAALAAFGVLREQPGTMKPNAPRPVVVQNPLPVPVPAASPAVRKAPVPSAHPGQVASVPPRKPAASAGSRAPGAADVATAARVADAAVNTPPSVETAAVVKKSHVPPPVRPVKAPLMASLPTPKPRVTTPAAPPAVNNVRVAVKPPSGPFGGRNADPVTTAPETAPPAVETGEPARPNMTQVAAVAPPLTRTTHEDALSNVRASLAALKSEPSPRKLYRDAGAHVQTAAYSSGGGFAPMLPTNYTPGLNDKP